MANRVDLGEVLDFQETSYSHARVIQTSLKEVEKSIKSINTMDSFSGEAADQAKRYFNEFHLTVIKTFSCLFTDISNKINQNINSFQAEVDNSRRALINSYDLQDIREDIKEDYESLQSHHDMVRSAIQSVSDISSASVPFIDESNSEKNTVLNHIKGLQEDLSTFTKINKNTQIDIVLNEMRVILNRASAVKEADRFTEYQKNWTTLGLTRLIEYNHSNQQITQEQIDNLDPESRAIYEKAKEDYEKGELENSVFQSIVSGVISTGAAFLQDLIYSKGIDKISEQITSSIMNWFHRNTLHFLDSDLAFYTNIRTIFTYSNSPSALSKIIRFGAKHGTILLGSVLDFSILVIKGEDPTDALIKSGGHLGIGVAAATIGSAFFPFAGTAGVLFLGVAGSLLFDAVYDKHDNLIDFIKSTYDSIKVNIGESVSGFFSNVDTVFNYPFWRVEYEINSNLH